MALNPMLVKEVYQSFRGWGLIIAFAIALTVPLLGFMEMVSTSHVDGGYYFRLVSIALAIVGIIILPVGAGSALRQDINSGTIELIALSRISPAKMIFGRFQASLLRLLLLFAAVAPFAVSALFMGGVTPPQVLVLLATILCCSITALALHIMCGALAAMDPRFSVPGLVLQLISLVVPLVLFVFGMIFIHEGMRHEKPWIPLSIGVAASFCLASIFLSLAIDMVTPAAIRNFARSKWNYLIVVLLFLLTLYGVFYFFTDRVDIFERMTFSDMEIIVVVLIGFFAMLVPAWAGVDRAKPHEHWRKPKLNIIFGDGLRNTLHYAFVVILLISLPLFLKDAEAGLALFLYLGSRFAMFLGLAGVLRAWINPGIMRGMVLWWMVLMLMSLSSIFLTFASYMLHIGGDVGEVFEPALMFVWDVLDLRVMTRQLNALILPFIVGTGLVYLAEFMDAKRGH